MSRHQPFNTTGEAGYLNLMEHILHNGYRVDNERTGTGTIVSPTPHQLYFPNVRNQFPLVTTKYVSFSMIVAEMLWMISGNTNANKIKDYGSHAMAKMWNKWADEDGELGPVYGRQWRAWEYWRCGEEFIDQLQNAIDTIKNNPESRRIIVSAWNPADLDDMALPPCHLMYQFTCEPLTLKERVELAPQSLGIKYSSSPASELDNYGVPKYRLHLHLTQRSCDMFLGVPFNIAEYALLLMMVAQVTNTVTGDFTWTGVNCHIYQNHVGAVEEQLSRGPKSPPMVILDEVDDIDDFTQDHISLHGYNPYNKIEAEVSV